MSPEPHELFPRPCQSCLCRLQLVVVGEAPGGAWPINGPLGHKIPLVDRGVVPGLGSSAALGAIVAQAEVGVVLPLIIEALPESHALKYTNMK